MSFDSRSVVVTGGTGALGRAVCKAFLERGADVFSSNLLEREVKSLDGALRDHPKFHLQRVDLTSEEEVAAWFASLGRLDVLVNVAGGFAMGTVAETAYGDWRFQQEMNLNTVFLTSRAALACMNPETGGRIINIAAYAATKKIGGMAAYTVSKAGVIHFTEALAEETLETKITVNALLPTIMDTPANRSAMPDADWKKWVPLETVAATILFLAGEEAWPITGACIPLRGHS